MNASALLLLAATGVILYVLFGYPLLLSVLARVCRKPVVRDFRPRTVSVLLPVRNGELWIRGKLDSIRGLVYPRELLDVLVISDGSTDRTDEMVREFAARSRHRVRLLRIEQGGKGAALNAGMAQATGEILFFTDVRQSLEPNSLRELVSCFADPAVGVASGELVILPGERHEQNDVGLYWRYEKWIRGKQSDMGSMPGATGAIYAMRRELAVPLPADVLLDDVYLPLAAFFRGYRVILDHSAVAFDYPTSLETEFGRKVRTLAGVYQLIRFFPALLLPSHSLWLHMVSHKLGRLLLPYALILCAAAGWGLEHAGARAAVLGAQLLFYFVAAADLFVPERSPWKRLTSPARTFVVLMAAAFMAVSILFRPSRKLWREAPEHSRKC